MSPAPDDPPPAAAASPAALQLATRGEVEAYLERLNRASPVALRKIARWGSAPGDTLRLQAVAMPERFAELGAFLGESTTAFEMEIEARGGVPDDAPYSVGLVLSGAMHVRGVHGAHVVRAGQGVIVNPAEIESTRLEAGTHLVEFALPKAPMLRLGAELDPGSHTGRPGFAPLLPAALAPRLLMMAREAARSIPAAGAASDLLFRRWLEMIGLTLLQEQPVHTAVRTRLANELQPPPAAVKRALDFIQAHAATDILLADIASAAHVSVSSLGRLFVRHLGQSPAALLRDVRLDRVREELRRGSAQSIRELAQRWGFHSPSQFSQTYQRRFGERPGQARRRG